MGFARFAAGSFRIAVLWLFLPTVGWVVAFIGFRATLSFMLFQLLRNCLSNGFSEELLWRGLLFTRLRRFFRTEWALLLPAMLFGMWHFGYDYTDSNRNLLFTVADIRQGETAFALRDFAS